MSKTSLFYKVILPSLCGFFFIFSGCWGSKDGDQNTKSPQAEADGRGKEIGSRELLPAEAAKAPQNPPAQLLTPVKQKLLAPVKQTESTPPIQAGAGPLESTIEPPRINQTSLTPVAMEPAARYGDQPIAPENEASNPLRPPEQPGPARTSESLTGAGVRSDVSLPLNAKQPPVNAEPPPKVQLHPKNKLTDVPFDPIKENGKIFVGWAKPKLALVITGMIEGYIEPCGCAGIDRMKGGMSRRYALFKTLREKDWPVVGLDVGGTAKGFGREAEIKFQTLVEAMRKTGYDAVALGATDLSLPAGEIAFVAANLNGQQSPFVSANVGLFGFDSGMTSTYRVISRGGMRVGVTSVLGKTYQKEINNSDLEIIDAEAGIKKILPKLKGQADYLVLLAHATKKETIELAKRFPDFNLVVTSDGQAEPPDKWQKITGTQTLYIEVGHKGSHAVVVGFFDDPQKTVRYEETAPILASTKMGLSPLPEIIRVIQRLTQNFLQARYQSVPLDSRFPPSPEMKTLMASYQDQLKTLGLAGLGLRAAPQPQKQTNGKFVGSAKCQSCHEESYRIWKKSLHCQALETLEKNDPPRNFDPECISCHVVGWHPTSFFPYQGGYEGREKTPKLADVGCESCHGPGEKHVAAESGDNDDLMKKYRLAVRITKDESKKTFCATCHDGDNSPDFIFDTYWPLVEHYETTKPDTNGQK